MITTKVATIERDESGIIHLNFPKEGVEIRVEDSMEILQQRISLGPQNERQLIVADLTSNPKPDREARDYAKSDEMNAVTKGLALIVGSGLSTILGNFFLGFNKGDYPVKLFTDKQDAIEWLKTL